MSWGHGGLCRVGHPSVDPALPNPPSLLPQVLKILLHLCGHGSSSFLLILKRNPAFIQEAAGMGQHCLQEAWEEGGQGRSRPEPLTRAPASLSHTRAPSTLSFTATSSLPFPLCQLLPSSPPGQASTLRGMAGVCP